MQTFAQYIDRWHDFYMLAGTAAATPLGLLFVVIFKLLGQKPTCSGAS